jgi:uncharacterized Rossmann fold enzyme
MKIDRIVFLAKRYGATRLILFGSAATGPSEARDVVGNYLNELENRNVL